MEHTAGSTYFRERIKPELRDAYDQFARDLTSLDAAEIWERHMNAGNLAEHAKVPFVLLTSSDDPGYCIQNGYFNATALTDEIVDAPAIELLDFIDNWVSAHDQEM
jgi:hypothetical protein